MNILKKLLVAMALMVAIVVPSKAATYTLTVASASTLYTQAFTNQNFALLSVTVANPSALVANVALFDAEATNATYVRAAFTNSYIYATNIVTTFTNYSAYIQTNTNSAIFTAIQTISATTNARPRFVTLTAGATNTTTWTPSVPLYGSFGLVITNSAATNVTVTVEYTF